MFSPAPDRAALRLLRATLRDAARTVVAFVTLDDGGASTGLPAPVDGGAHGLLPRRSLPGPAAEEPRSAPGTPLVPSPRGARSRFRRVVTTLEARQAHPHHHPLGSPPAHRRPAAGPARCTPCLSPVLPRAAAAPLRPARLVWSREASPAAVAGCRTPRTTA